jgi:heme oxygenase (biliverdin-IX-beta and delta-forming)
VTEPAEDQRFEDARQLWAGRFQAVLSTQSLAEPGYPFGSVVPYCLDRQGRALLLLSHLAQHTKNLDADPRCGLCLYEATQGDVQQGLRLSCLADAEPVDPADVGSHGRWLRYFPASRPYLEQLNFHLYRISPRRFHYNGGFASARWLGTERILRPSPLDQAEETRLLTALADLPGLLQASAGDPGTPPRILGVDPWGLDLALGERLGRIPLAGPYATLESLRGALVAAWAPWRATLPEQFPAGR